MLFFIAQTLLVVKHSQYYTLLVMFACHHYLLSFYKLVEVGKMTYQEPHNYPHYNILEFFPPLIGQL